MKILDILLEADDGSRAANDQSLKDAVLTARHKWLLALRNKGANPDNEQSYVQEYLATQNTYGPVSNTMAPGLFNRAAQKRYAARFHKEDPNWNHDEAKNTRLSGNQFDATDSALKVAGMGGDLGNAGDNAGRAQIDAKTTAERGLDTLGRTVQTIAQGNTPKTPPSEYSTMRRDGDQKHRVGQGVDVEDHATRDAFLAQHDTPEEQPAAGNEISYVNDDGSEMDGKQRQQHRMAIARKRKREEKEAAAAAANGQ